MYKALPKNDPRPGCMAICLDCRHRGGVSCDHPAAQANGGAGVMLTIVRPSTCFVDGRDKDGKRFGRMEMHYSEPARSCAQHVPATTSHNPEQSVDSSSPVG